MFDRLRLPGILFGLMLVALASPRLAGLFFFNLANTQIARAVVLPSDAPTRATMLVDADANLARAESLSNPSRLALARARLALAQNDLSGALAALEPTNASLRSDFIAQFLWGDAAWRLDERDKAVEHWRLADAREFFRQAMNRAQYAHQWQDAERFARIAIAIDASWPDAHYVLADALAQHAANSQEALEELSRAQALTQDVEFLSTVLSRRGEILASQGQIQDALSAFDQARRSAPLDARPRTDYAMVSVRADPRAKTEAITLLEQVVGDSPWYSAAYLALAEISEADAELWLKKGLDKNPKDAALWFALGRWYTNQHRLSEARAALIEALQNENRADLLQEIAHALQGLPAE